MTAPTITPASDRLARLEDALWTLHAKRGQYDARSLVDQILADVTPWADAPISPRPQSVPAVDPSLFIRAA